MAKQRYRQASRHHVIPEPRTSKLLRLREQPSWSGSGSTCRHAFIFCDISSTFLPLQFDSVCFPTASEFTLLTASLSKRLAGSCSLWVLIQGRKWVLIGQHGSGVHSGPISSFVHLLFGELDPLLRKMHTHAIFTHNFKGFTELRHNHEP